MKPGAPDLREQSVAWVLTFCADWEECRDDCYYGPEKAWSLLAAWGTVGRCFAELPEALASARAVIKQDTLTLLAALRQAPDPAEWLDRARQLDRAWDFAVGEDALRELEMGAIDLFDCLDRHSLALCMARRLDSGSEVAHLISRTQLLTQAEGYFAQHVEVFLPAAYLASAEIAACRPDLEAADPELWLTTRKHRQLEEVWKEMEVTALPQSLTEQDKQAIQAKVSQRLGAVSLSSGIAGRIGPDDGGQNHSPREICVRLVFHDGKGFQGEIKVEVGFTVAQLFARELPHLEGQECFPSVNGQEVRQDYILREGDQVSFTPRGVKAAAESQPQQVPSEVPGKELITIKINDGFDVMAPDPNLVVLEAGLTIEQAFQRGLIPRNSTQRNPTSEVWGITNRPFTGTQTLQDGDILFFESRGVLAAAPGFDVEGQERRAKRDALVEYLTFDILMEIIGQATPTQVWFLFAGSRFDAHITRHTYNIYEAYFHSGHVVESELPQLASGTELKPPDRYRIRKWLLRLTDDEHASKMICSRLQQGLP